MHVIKVIAAITAALLTLLFTWIWYSRRALPYGSEGQYFDATSGVSYSDGAVIAYGAAAFVLGLLALLLAILAWRR